MQIENSEKKRWWIERGNHSKQNKDCLGKVKMRCSKLQKQ